MTLSFKKLGICLVGSFFCCYNLGAAPLTSTYQLPPFERASPQSLEAKTVKESQVLQKAAGLKLSFAMIDDYQFYTQQLTQHITEGLSKIPSPLQESTFTGDSTHALNSFINTVPTPALIKINAAQLNFDAPIVLKSGISLQGHPTKIIGNWDSTVFTGEHVENITLQDFSISDSKMAIYLSDVRHFVLSDLNLQRNQRGIFILGSSALGSIHDNVIEYSRDGGLVFMGNIKHVWVRHNQFNQGQDSLNWHAGLVMSDTPLGEEGLGTEADFIAYAAQTPILRGTDTLPAFNIIQDNSFKQNRAAGLYVDGGVGNVILDNQFLENDKQGLCLEGGALFNVVQHNRFLDNGSRLHQNDASLQQEGILNLGKLSDGSSVAKLPAIALDNAAYNLLIENTLQHNSGDGITLVRSAFRNILMFNTLLDNNQGQNSQFGYSGITVGYLPETEQDQGNHDFVPSVENIVAANTIYGAHYAGILLEKDTTFNDIYNNLIYKFRQQAIVDNAKRFNSLLDNAFPVIAPAPIITKIEPCENREDIALLIKLMIAAILLSLLMSLLILVKIRHCIANTCAN